VTHARALLCVLAALALTGCGSTSARRAAAARGPVVELTASYHGVRLGTPLARVAALLGPPLKRHDSPYLQPRDAPPFLPEDNPGEYVYPDVNVTFVAARVASLTVYGREAATSLGVRLGGALAQVPMTYAASAVRCLGPRGGSQPLDAGCQVTLGPDRFLYFGGDPIRSIALSARSPAPQMVLGGSG